MTTRALPLAQIISLDDRRQAALGRTCSSCLNYTPPLPREKLGRCSGVAWTATPFSTGAPGEEGYFAEGRPLPLPAPWPDVEPKFTCKWWEPESEM